MPITPEPVAHPDPGDPHRDAIDYLLAIATAWERRGHPVIAAAYRNLANHQHRLAATAGAPGRIGTGDPAATQPAPARNQPSRKPAPPGKPL